MRCYTTDELAKAADAYVTAWEKTYGPFMPLLMDEHIHANQVNVVVDLFLQVGAPGWTQDHVKGAVASVKAHYPLDVFPWPSKTPDGQAAEMARRTCDNILKELEP
jgi:hypothetical protein